MNNRRKPVGLFLILFVSPLLFSLSCSKKEEESSSSSTSTQSSTCVSKRTFTSVTKSSHKVETKRSKNSLMDFSGLNRTLTASTKVPLLVVRVQYADATFQSSETSWANKIFGTSDGQMNHYLAETTYNKLQFNPITETSGTANDGLVTVTMSGNHPNTQKDSWNSYAFTAITAVDSSVNFASYDNDSNGKLSVSELQVIFLVAGGESASSINTPGGVWGMATGLAFDPNGDGYVLNTPCTSSSEECNGVEMDNVWFLGLNSTGQNGFSQFGERQGSSSTNTWDATIGVMAHELAHAYLLLPDLYCTSGSCAGIGNFGLMGGGAWGYKSSSEKSGATPVHLSAWSKENLSICTPQTVSSGTNSLTLPAVYQSSIHAASCGIYKATTSTSGEYFLFENRSTGGYDKGFNYLLLNGSESTVVESSYSGGLAIWHVKDILSTCYENNTCETQSPPLVDLEEANNPDLDSGSSSGRTTHLFYNGNSVSFSNSSTPDSKLYDCSSSGISATSISAAGNNMTLTISK
jgi:M6 family metalloprotease-like protein